MGGDGEGAEQKAETLIIDYWKPQTLIREYVVINVINEENARVSNEHDYLPTCTIVADSDRLGLISHPQK